MVSVVTGNGLGLERSSGYVLGSRGQLGSAGLGRANDGVSVNAATGNLIIQNTDEILLGQGPDAVINRTYNSLGAYTNLAGAGDPDNWLTNTQRKIVLTGTGNAAGSTATLTDWDGTVIVFTWVNATVGYKASENPYRDDTLTWAGNVFTWTEGKSRTVQTFASNIGGRIVNAADADGNTITYTYDAATTAGKLTRVTTVNGGGTVSNYVDMTYDGSSRLASLVTGYHELSSGTNKTLTRVRYGYDTSNRLTTVTVDLSPNDNAIADAKTYVTTYGYSGTSKLVSSITQSDGTAFAIVYDGSNRVSTMTQTVAGVARTTTFTYDTVNRITTITDPLSNVSKMTYDTAGRLTRVEEPAPTGGVTSVTDFTYNGTGDVMTVFVTEGIGGTAVARDYYQYDANGNVTQLYRWTGTDYRVTRWTYGAKNELLTETVFSNVDADGDGGVAPTGAMTTRYAYDAENHLRFAVTQEGRVTEYKYDAAGNVIATISYTGTLFPTAGIAANTSISETSLANWVTANADKSQSQRTDNVYDFRGNITTSTSWSKTDAAGAGVTTEDWSRMTYVYDQAGRLLSRLVSGTNVLGGEVNAAETFVYDGLGRVISMGDVYGQTTTITINDGTRVTTVSTPNDVTRTSTFNNGGELISVAESGSGITTGTTSYDYDKLGRLRVQTDPVGVKTYFVYDKQSRLTGQVDGDGSLTEFRYDGADRLIATIKYATAVSAANLTTLATASTNTEIAAIRPVANAADRWGWSIYDKSGKLTGTIDAMGAVTKLSYDGAGRLTNTTRYNAVLAAATVTGYKTTLPTTLTLPTADDTYDRPTRAFYDNDGLLIAELDEDGFLTEHVYDKAGRKVETIRYAVSSANHLTSAAQPAYWRTATLAQLKVQATASPASDIHNYWIYDGRGRVAAVIDGEGNVTRYHYTARGDLDQEIRGQKVTANTSYTLATLPAPTGTLETTRYYRNAAGQVTSQVKYLSGGHTETTTYSYDTRGRLVTQTVAETVSTETRTQRFRYDVKGRLIGSLDGVGAATLVASPTDAQIATAINSYGTRYNYDAADRLISRIDPDGTGATGNTTRFYYDGDGQLRFEINALGEVTEHRYNILEDRTDTFVYGTRIAPATLTTLTGGLVNATVTNAVAAIANTSLDSRTQWAYDARGQLSIEYNPLYVASPTQSNYRTFGYNSFGEQTNNFNPTDTPGAHWDDHPTGYFRRGLLYWDYHYLNGGTSGAVKTGYGYDAFRRRISMTLNDTDWRGPDWAYDRASRVTQQWNNLGVSATFAYDARSNLISQTDRNGKTTTFGYDVTDKDGNAIAVGNRTGHFRTTTTTTAEGIVSRVTKNAYGQTIQITDGAGRTTSYTYDKNGNLKTVTDAAGTTTNTYDNADRLIETTDAKGVKTRFTYDAANRVLTRVEDYGSGTLNLTTTYVYDAKGQSASVTDALGVVTTYTYDLKGQKTRIVQDAGSGKLNITTDFVYRGDGKVIWQTDAVGTAAERKTFFEYDSLGRLTRKTEDQGSGKLNVVTNYTWDENNNLVATSDNLARVTRFVYDLENRLQFTVNAEGEVTENGYDAEGRVIWTRAYVNRIAAGTLAGFGNKITAAQVTGNVTASTTGDAITRTLYDGDGRATYAVDAEGYVTRNVYDGANNVIKTIRYATAAATTNATTKADLDTLFGNAASPPATAAVTTYTYDAANRLTDITDAEGSVTHFEMDALGQVTYTTVAYGTTDASQTYRVFDNVGRVTQETRALGDAAQSTTYFAYNAHGNVTSITDPRGFVTTRTYDNLGRMLSETVPLDAATSATTSYQYDARGNRVKITDPRGNAGYFYYDGVDRLTLQVDPEGYVTETAYLIGSQVSSVKRYYNKANNLGSVSATVKPTVTAHAQDATTSFAYDKAYRVLSSTDAMGFTESYTYDGLGNRTSLTNKLGGVTNYGYDKNGRLVLETKQQNAHDYDGTVVLTSVQTSYAYDARGNLISKIDAANAPAGTNISTNRITTTYTYDRLDRLTSKAEVGFADQVNTTSYQYDRRGNVILQTNGDGGKTYSFYDDGNRKIAEISPVNTLSTWAYDANGNVLSQKIYSDIVSFPGAAGGTPPTSTSAYRETIYDYDRNNRLLGVTQQNVLVGYWNGSSYVTQTVSITSVNQYDVAGNLVKETDRNGQAIHHYFDKNGREIAKVDQEGYLTTWTYDAEGNALEDRRFANKVGTQFAQAVTVSTAVSSLVSSAGYNGLDRITAFTYDKNGRRLTETRYNVNASVVSGNSVGAGAVHSAISYAYNGLGEVTSKTEASGDVTAYAYDNQGRLVKQTDAAITDFNGVVAVHVTRFYYDANNNLVRTEERAEAPGGGLASGYTASDDRVTRYGYNRGKLQWTIDASGFQRNLWYDVMGRATYDYYSRIKSDGSYDTTYNGNLTSYDLAGRVVSQWQADYTGNTWTTVGPVTQYTYNRFGDVTGRYLGGALQEIFQYDNAGRLEKSSGGDGVWRFYLYDGNGNATGTLQSNGRNMSGDTMASILAYVGSIGTMTVADVVGTVTVYDKRNMALQTRETNRTIANAAGTGTISQTLVRSRTYNAYGEVTSETDARGNVTDFAYNTMGRLTQKQSPWVTVTGENGVDASARPTENYYYDASGRLVGYRDANNYLTTRTLLAGTGYGGSEAKVLKEFRPDGSVWETRYDAFGDARRSLDGLNRVTQMFYDKMGRLTQSIMPSGTSENFAYDGLGQRIKHWNSAMQSPIYGPPPIIDYDYYTGLPIYGPAPIIGYTQAYEYTDYDIQGRVTRTANYAGDVTTYAYAWSGSAVNGGVGIVGGWVKTSSFANGHTTTETQDAFGRMLNRTDQGGHVYTYVYNMAGQLTGSTSTVVSGTGGQNLTYTYYNTGKLATIFDNTGGAYGYSTSSTDATYTYDADGNRRYERYQTTGYYYDPYGGSYPYTITHQEGVATWDGMNRMLTFNDTGASGNGAVAVTNKYDAVGNVRRTTATYNVFDYAGNMTGTQTTSDYWYRYDALNRFVTTKGQLVGGVIVRGNDGVGRDITYNLAGERASASRTITIPGTYEPYIGYMPGYTYESREVYSYNVDGRLTQMNIAAGAWATEGTTPPPATGSGTQRAVYQLDALGRITRYTEYAEDGATVNYDRYAIVYDLRNNVTSETNSTRKFESTGTNTYVTSITNYYGAGGIISSSYSSTNKNGAYSSSDSTSYTYEYWDAEKQKTIASVKSPGGTHTSTFYYDQNAHLTSVNIADGRPRTVNFANDAQGQVLSRTESSSSASNPKQLYYYFNGLRVGANGNNGNDDPEFVEALAQRTAGSAGNGAFQNGATTATPYADFDQSYDPINPQSPGAAAQSYTVRDGDTLQSIAQAIWGDASLWYMLAEANGLTAQASLTAGQLITIPNKVSNVHNNAGTFRPYDPNKAIGDVNPTTPTQPKPKKAKCGVFGQILLAVIAVAVTLVLRVPITNLIAGQAAVAAAGTAGIALTSTAGILGAGLAAAAGSIVSQAFGVATGIQDKFSFKAVAMAGIGGAIGAGLSGWNPLGVKAGTFLNDVARGTVSNVATQGVAVASGLQERFDWAGIAVAGVSAGVAGVVKSALGVESMAGRRLGAGVINGELSLKNIVASGLTNMASSIAGAATRSAIEGSNFGDNVVAALPSAIGSTIGEALVEGARARMPGHFRTVDEYIENRRASLREGDRDNLLFYTMSDRIDPEIKRDLWGKYERNEIEFDRRSSNIITVGEYDESTGIIGIDKSHIKFSSNPLIGSKIAARVVWADLEEQMHHMDRLAWDQMGIKTGDTYGDEGALFAYMKTGAMVPIGGNFNYGLNIDGKNISLSADFGELMGIRRSAISGGSIFSENRIGSIEHFGPAGHYYSAFVMMLGGLRGSTVPVEEHFEAAHGFALGAQLGDRVDKINAFKLWVGHQLGRTVGGERVSEARMEIGEAVFHALVPDGSDDQTWQESNRANVGIGMENAIAGKDYLTAGIFAHWIGDSFAHRHDESTRRVYYQPNAEWRDEYVPIRGYRVGMGHGPRSTWAHLTGGEDPVDGLYARPNYTREYAEFLSKHIGAGLARQTNATNALSIQQSSYDLWSSYYSGSSTSIAFATKVQSDFPRLMTPEVADQSTDRNFTEDESNAVNRYLGTWRVGN